MHIAPTPGLSQMLTSYMKRERQPSLGGFIQYVHVRAQDIATAEISLTYHQGARIKQQDRAEHVDTYV